MTQATKYKAFNVMEVLLQGSNLIEASAGTGKTYSIAILALRLILEKKIPIQEILIVTFTKAAVAELEERIRFFVRNAYRYSNGEDIADDIIKELVDRNIDANELLKSAIIYLDETKVMSIHGFSQKTLNEFAFETGQLFNTELITNTSSIIEAEVQSFWRKHVTSIQKDLLAEMLNGGQLSQENIIQIINGHLSGKNYIFYHAEDRNFDFTTQEIHLKKLLEVKKELADYEQVIENYFSVNREDILARCYADSNAKKKFPDLVDNYKEIFKNINAKNPQKYIVEKFQDFLEFKVELDKKREKIKEQSNETVNYFYSFAINSIVPKIFEHRLKNSLMSFDDMIQNLNSALKGAARESLAIKLSNKYKAVFIDEFQDTDRTQYEIFKHAFNDRSILFYIGDPKQSIYAFRSADIETYLEARDQAGENVFGMNINYRSTAKLIRALNQFFLPTEDFDTFYTDGKILFHEVKYPTGADNKGEFLYNGSSGTPININIQNNKDNINKNLANLIYEMLSDDKYTIFDTISQTSRKIIPSDICVLVRTNIYGATIKSALSKLGIPAVTMSAETILNSNEAIDIIYLLEAMLRPTQSNVRRALITGFFQYRYDDLLTLDDEVVIQQFYDYNLKWKKVGIYATMMTLITDFGIQQNLLSNHTENGERILTNLYQLAELLYKTEHRRRFNPDELLDWFKINLEKDQADDDEWEQRIESDEDAVKIVSIHKSKGLQYPIVIAPELDFTVSNIPSKIISFRNADGKYVTAKYSQLSEKAQELYIKQEEQENRRLLYVALTRAVYACYIFKSNASTNKSSTLSKFLEKITYNDLIGEIKDIPVPYDKYNSTNQDKPIVKHPTSFSLSETKWERISYSRISGDHELTPRDKFIQETQDYDRFIFNELTKGSKTGTIIHTMFERTRFNEPDTWKYTITNIAKQYYPKAEANFLTQLETMLEHVMYTNIITENGILQLSQISMATCVHELEFDFPLQKFNVKHLENLMEGVRIKNGYSEIEGMMNGKVDLFFLHKGKYYILDWKTNHLGYQTDDYSSQKVVLAMKENNYHLQYLIYTCAIKKHLQFQLKNFDYNHDFGGVIYLFIRGVRKDQTTGIFFSRPNIELINKLEFLFAS